MIIAFSIIPYKPKIAIFNPMYCPLLPPPLLCSHWIFYILPYPMCLSSNCPGNHTGQWWGIYIHTAFSHATSSSPSIVTFLWPPTQDIHLDLISHSLAVNLSAFPLTCVENWLNYPSLVTPLGTPHAALCRDAPYPCDAPGRAWCRWKPCLVRKPLTRMTWLPSVCAI